jgi:hypothetical protein
MEKPFLKVSEPFKLDFKGRTKKIIIYSYYKEIEDEENEKCEHCGSSYCYDEDCLNDNRSIDLDQPNYPKVALEKINLQFILNLIPEGVKYEDIKMDMGHSQNSHYIEGYYINFYYNKKLSDRLEEYDKAMEAYNKAKEEYEKEKIKYDEWCKQEKIKKLEKELQNLKK